MVVEMDHNMPVDCWVFEHFLNGFFSQKHEQLGLNGFPHKTSQSYSHVRSPSLCRWSCDEKLVAPGCLLQMNLAECHRGFRSVPRQESCRQRCHIPLSGRWATWFMSHLGSLGPSEWPLADLGPKNSGTNMDQHGPIWTNGFLETQTSHGLNVRSELDIFQQVDEVSMPSVKTSVLGCSTGFPWFWVIWKLWKFEKVERWMLTGWLLGKLQFLCFRKTSWFSQNILAPTQRCFRAVMFPQCWGDSEVR